MKKILIFSILVACAVARPNLNEALHRTAEKIKANNERIAEKTSAAFKNAGESIREAGENIRTASENLGTKTAQAFKNAGEDIRTTSQNIGTKTSDAFKTAGEKTSQAFKNAGENIHNAHEDMATKTSEALSNAKENIHEKSEQLVTDIKENNERVKEKTTKIIKGEEPIIDVAVNSRVKVLNSTVGVQGEVKIGFGHQTSIHGSADATVLGQQAKIHADILNAHGNGEGHNHTSIVKKVKGFVKDKFGKDEVPTNVGVDQGYGTINQQYGNYDNTYPGNYPSTANGYNSYTNTGETYGQVDAYPISQGQGRTVYVDNNRNTYNGLNSNVNYGQLDAYPVSQGQGRTVYVDNNRNTYNGLESVQDNYNSYPKNQGRTSNQKGYSDFQVIDDYPGTYGNQATSYAKGRY